MVAETKVGVGGVWKDLDSIEVGVGGVWKTVKSVEVGVGGVWKTVYEEAADLTVSIPSSLSSSEYTPTDATVTITPTISGGTAPYSYQWALVGSNQGLISNSSLTGSSLTLTVSEDAAPQFYTETWKVTVTDSTSTPKVTTSGNCVVGLQIEE